MFIIKFNNMIRNKWIWGIFATIVAFAFAGSDLSCGSKGDKGSGVGSLEGEPVSQAEYEIVRRSVMFENEGSKEPVTNPERETWERLAALKVAADLGIKVSDNELASYIQADPSFHDQSGAFTAEMFRRVLKNVGMEPVFYEEMLRRRITLGRLEQVVTSSAWVPPATLALRARGYTDSFTLCTAVVSNKFKASEMKLTEEEVREFYDRHPEMYTEPDKRQVVYSVFKAKDYLNEVSVEEDEVIDFYDSNVSRYVVKDTNGVEKAKPLEEVRQTIEDELANEAAKLMAYRAAADFSDVFYTNRSETLTFEAAAASMNIPVITSRVFTATSSPVIVDGSPAFVEAAFALDNESPVNRFSEAVNGGPESYVMGFLTNIASHVTPFEQVLPKVRADAQLEAADAEFRSALDTVIEALVLGMESGKKFRDIAAEQKMTVSTNFVFSFMAAYAESPVPAARQIANAMSGLGAGEISTSPLLVPEGALFFEVVERTQGENVMYDSIKRQAFNTMFSDAATLVWDEWLRTNLAGMNPTTPIPLDSDVEAEAEAE